MVVGPVAAGGIFDATQSYEAAFYMGGSVFILGAIVMGLIPFAIKRFSKPESKSFSKRESHREVTPNGRQKRSSKNGSIVKPNALRKLAHQQSALRGKVSNKSKWNGEVATHLRELHEIEEELMNEKRHSNGKHVTVKLPEAEP